MKNLNILSDNVRGLRSKKKRLKVFSWLHEQSPDIIFLQETHSCISDENEWQQEWGGEILLAHKETNSAGTAVLIKNNSNIIITDTVSDTDGYYNILTINISNKTFILVNIYSPIKDAEQSYKRC